MNSEILSCPKILLPSGPQMKRDQQGRLCKGLRNAHPDVLHEKRVELSETSIVLFIKWSSLFAVSTDGCVQPSRLGELALILWVACLSSLPWYDLFQGFISSQLNRPRNHLPLLVRGQLCLGASRDRVSSSCEEWQPEWPGESCLHSWRFLLACLQSPTESNFLNCFQRQSHPTPHYCEGNVQETKGQWVG